MRSYLLALVLLAACGQSTTPAKAPEAPAAHAPDANDLQITIGRYGVMLDHVATLTRELPDAAPAAAAQGAPTDTSALARQLREGAWEYNLVRSKLCARGLYTAQSCGPAFEPVWISDPASAQPTLAEIQQRAEALGEEVQPFWNTVCDDARNRAANEQDKMYVCAIE